MSVCVKELLTLDFCWVRHNDWLKCFIPESPTATIIPDVVMFVRGATVNVTCTAIAYPPPTFHWKRNGKLLPLSDNLIYDDKGLLMLNELSKEDGGDYECVATNIAGTGSALVNLQYIGEDTHTHTHTHTHTVIT